MMREEGTFDFHDRRSGGKPSAGLHILDYEVGTHPQDLSRLAKGSVKAGPTFYLGETADLR